MPVLLPQQIVLGDVHTMSTDTALYSMTYRFKTESVAFEKLISTKIVCAYANPS